MSAADRVSETSSAEQANEVAVQVKERTDEPVLTSGFLAVLNHFAFPFSSLFQCFVSCLEISFLGSQAHSIQLMSRWHSFNLSSRERRVIFFDQEHAYEYERAHELAQPRTLHARARFHVHDGLSPSEHAVDCVPVFEILPLYTWLT